ncbi:MAG: HypC/HybG/HupF family hydrogenase formation chaperone [Nitrospinales bacterium]
MCLAVPAKIVKIENETSTVEVGGVQRIVSLMLLDGAKVGDFVIIHAGFVIRLLDKQDALETLSEIRSLFPNTEKNEFFK